MSLPYGNENLICLYGFIKSKYTVQYCTVQRILKNIIYKNYSHDICKLLFTTREPHELIKGFSVVKEIANIMRLIYMN